MILQIYTIIHTLISLIALFTGFVVLFGDGSSWLMGSGRLRCSAGF